MTQSQNRRERRLQNHIHATFPTSFACTYADAAVSLPSTLGSGLCSLISGEVPEASGDPRNADEDS